MNKCIMVGTICATLLTTSVFAEFKDVNRADSYYNDVIYVKESRIFSGESDDIFAPDKNMTRAMLVQIIHNIENNPESEKIGYDDVIEDEWYFDAISWATNKEIVKGMGNNKFEPDTLITKEQLITVLYNYAKYRGFDVSAGEDTNILSYEDALSLPEYAYLPMQWACGVGILKNNVGLLNHSNPVTRAEVSGIMKSFSQIYIKDTGLVRLNGNATTGYVWNVISYDRDIVFVDECNYYEDRTDKVLTGLPGVFEFKVTAMNPGSTEIVFEYARPWEEEAVKTVVCEANVSSDGRVDILLKSEE